MQTQTIKNVAVNKKARHNYEILDQFEAGVVLVGSEVKSLRNGSINLKDAYCGIKNGEVYVFQMHISPYTYATHINHEALRPRKLLLHKQEIKRLYGKVKEKGLALVPLKVYFKGGRIKVSIALAKGKRLYDKREAIKKRDEKRVLDREKKERGY